MRFGSTPKPMASDGAAPPTVAVAVRPGGSGSRLAARWVAAGLPDDGRAIAVAVVHVIPELSFVPSPCKLPSPTPSSPLFVCSSVPPIHSEMTTWFVAAGSGGGGGAAGERVPVALVGRDPAETYARDRRARAEEALLPFRRLYCSSGRRGNVTVSAPPAESSCLVFN